MFSDLSEIRQDLADLFRATLPNSWVVEQALTAPYESLVPVVYMAFTGFDSTVDGGPLPRGQVAAQIDVYITDPDTSHKGEDKVDEHVLQLVRAIDPQDDLAWGQARKERLEDGGLLAWRLTLTALVFTPEPTEPEDDDPEPEDEPSEGA